MRESCLTSPRFSVRSPITRLAIQIINFIVWRLVFCSSFAVRSLILEDSANCIVGTKSSSIVPLSFITPRAFSHAVLAIVSASVLRACNFFSLIHRPLRPAQYSASCSR